MLFGPIANAMHTWLADGGCRPAAASATPTILLKPSTWLWHYIFDTAGITKGVPSLWIYSIPNLIAWGNI